MKKNLKYSYLLSVLFIKSAFLSSCASSYTALQKVEPGLTKQETRIELGMPHSVGRSNNKDRWTYKFKKDSLEYTQNVFFDDGRLIKVGPLTPYPNYKKKMIEADTLEDYEINAALYQKQKEAGFREINSIKKNDINEFCSNLFHYSERQEKCEATMANKKFMYSSLVFCQEEIGGYGAKIDCLSAIGNKIFHPASLEICREGSFLDSNFQKLNCLKKAFPAHLFIPKTKKDIVVVNCVADLPLGYGNPITLPCRAGESRCEKENNTGKESNILEVYNKYIPSPPFTLISGKKYTIAWKKKALVSKSLPEDISWFKETGNIICDFK